MCESRGGTLTRCSTLCLKCHFCSESSTHASCLVCVFSLPYCWIAALTFVFVNSREVLAKDMLQHAHLSPFQGRFHQVTHCAAPVSVRQRRGLKHPFICVCDYQCKHLSCLSVHVLAENWCAVVSFYLSCPHISAHRPQKQELLRRPCKATASSLRNHWHLNSSNVVWLPTLISVQVSWRAG